MVSILRKEDERVVRSPSDKFAHLVNGGALHAAAYFHHAKCESTSANGEFPLLSSITDASRDLRGAARKTKIFCNVAARSLEKYERN
ncbi:MAG: hypothetical protein QOD99_1894 [Chthoniobacter sp.]|nr:hypothetical protein [Chthoniobacter sp.]